MAVERARRPHRHGGAGRAIAESRSGARAADRRTIFEMAGGEFNINSPKQLAGSALRQAAAARAAAHRRVDGAVDRRRSARGARADARHLPRQILEWRQLMKLKGTYIDALPAAGPTRNRPRAHAASTRRSPRTGRLSSSDPNLQNIPIRTRARPRDPPRLHRRSRPRADLRRLLADRVPRAGAPLRGARRWSTPSARASTFTSGRR